MFDKDNKYIRTVCGLYEAFYQVTSKNPTFSYVPSVNNEKTIVKFIRRLIKRYGINAVGFDLISSYFQFQFNYWYRLDTRFGSGKIMIDWIIGEKAFERWENRRKEYVMYSVSNGIKSDLKISIEHLRKLFNGEEQEFLLCINEAEELEKSRFYNTEKGFFHCLQLTTLHNSKSKFCKNCKNSEQCLDVLKNTYPAIFKKRLV